MNLRPDPVKTRSELGLPPTGPLLVNVGRQTAQKGQLSLLEAFSRIRNEVDAHLVIVGREGEASPMLRRRIDESGLSEHVTLTGYTPDVHHYVANASVFVFTSLMEGLGTAVIEALAIGCPVVAYDIPPVREATDNGAHADLVDPGDQVSFAKAVMAVLERGESDPRSRIWFVQERYGMESIARQVERRLEWVATQ
jgi:glycosyltransferase involved in cell wall biosynthesis